MVQEYIVRCRGLPFACTEAQLKEWIGDRDIESVCIPNGRDGRPTGEGFIIFKTQSSYDLALKKDRENMGSRYIEVFAGTSQDKEIIDRNERSGSGWGSSERRSTFPPYIPPGDYVVRLRGLPFAVEPSDIKEFFDPLPIVQDGILFPSNKTGKTAGEAYVVFAERANAEEALKRDRNHMKHRYIEVFKSSREEMATAVGWVPADEGWGGRSGGSGGPMMRMRGEPREDYYAQSRYGGGGARGRPMPYERYERPGGYGNGGSAWGGGSGQAFDYPEGYGGSRGGVGGSVWSGGYDGFGYADREAYAGDLRRGDPWASYSKDSYDGGMSFNEGPRPLFENWRAGDMKSLFGGGNRRYVLKMRGIPFKAEEEDIYRFFGENRPSFVEILFESNGRAAGEARVEFSTRLAYDQALSKDKEYMGSRYVELFPDSTPNRF
ncbi:unnamed protein product, partial [Mesorhabditis belari]|uniref:RRM domain-containing protein n=1 Tax=Mesorhabditis belari TaxID=2138241 RepID=A0AAF3J7N1_9BILA